MADIVLRGRAEPMTAALALLRRVIDARQGGGLIITGEAGIGKTAFLSAVLREARRLGMVCGSVRADQIGRLVAGGPLLTALQGGPDPVLPVDSRALLGHLAGEPLLLVDAMAQALEQASAVHPVLVAVDDAQWLDDLSVFLLRTLPGRLAGLPVGWLLSSRSGSLPLLDALAGGPDSDLYFPRVELGPLAVSDIVALASDRMGAIPGSATRQMLGRAGGNPFLAVQVVSGLLSAQAQGADPGDLPGELVRAVRRLLQTLPSRAVDLVRLAAVYGERLPLDDAAELLDDVSARAVADAADEAVEAGLLSSEHGAVLFRHDLVRESVYAGLPERTRQFIHLSCARHLRDAGCDALTVAAHARAAIRPGDEAVALLLADAAGQAVTTLPQTAAELMLTSFSALRPGQPSWLAVGERCVEILSLVQRCTDAIAVADRLLAYIDDDESAGRLEVALSRALWLTARWEEAETRGRAALGRPGLSPALRARLEALHALALSRVRSRSEAQPMAEHALATSGMAADRTGRLLSLHALAEIARNAGDHRTSLTLFRQLRAEDELVYFAQEIMALQHLDRYSDAETLLAQAWQQADRDNAAALPSLLYAQIWQDYNLARLDGAEAAARTLVTLGRELGSRVCQMESASVLTAVALVRGDVAEARRRGSACAPAETADLAHVPVLLLVRGWLMAEEGDPALAVKLLTPLLQSASGELDPWPWKPGWMPVLARIGLSGGDPGFAARAAELAEEGARRNTGVATFEAIALGVRGLLEDDLHRLARAAGAAVRSPRPLIRAGILEDYGRALVRAGDLPAAGSLLDQAWALYDEAGAGTARARVQRVMRAAGIRRSWWTAAGSRPTSGWEALTETEMRVARLISNGHTNKSAAAQLRVSVNTVGTHLRSIFAKLEVRSRVQLTNLVNEHQLVG